MKKNVLCNGFSEMTEMEMYAFNGGWSWKGFFNSIGNCALSGLKIGAIIGGIVGVAVGAIYGAIDYVVC